MNVYASWNGATEVASWEVLAGAAPTRAGAGAHGGARGLRDARSRVTASARYVAVRALDAGGRRARHVAGAARRRLSRQRRAAVVARAAAQPLELAAELRGDGGVARVGVARVQLAGIARAVVELARAAEPLDVEVARGADRVVVARRVPRGRARRGRCRPPRAPRGGPAGACAGAPLRAKGSSERPSIAAGRRSPPRPRGSSARGRRWRRARRETVPAGCRARGSAAGRAWTARRRGTCPWRSGARPGRSRCRR